ncbi:MAG: RNA methyltransferase [Candidatus Micrarchaeota archaeon]
MAKFRFVLVEPEYEANLGAAARLMKNFGQKQMYLVNPDCYIGFTAKMHAKHALNILKKAKICKSVKEAVKGCSMVVGTTGIMRRHKNVLRHPLTSEQFRKKIEGKEIKGEIAVLFGREGIGLNEKEIESCDLLITIPTSAKYTVMNITHAMAIVLYVLCAQEKRVRKVSKRSDAGERKQLIKTIEELVGRYEGKLRNVRKAKIAFKRVIGRAVPDEVEVRAMLSVLKHVQKELKEK